MKKGIKVTRGNLSTIKFRLEKMIGDCNNFTSQHHYPSNKRQNSIMLNCGIKFNDCMLERVEESRVCCYYNGHAFVEKEIDFIGGKDCFLRITNNNKSNYSAFIIQCGDYVKLNKKSADIYYKNVMTKAISIHKLKFEN